MRFFHFPAKAAIALILACFGSQAAWAQPASLPPLPQIQAVTLYPGSARLEVTGKAFPAQLESGETALTAYLPGHADPGTLSVEIDGKLAGINIERLSKEDASDPILAPWKAALLAAENERDSLKAEQEAVAARISMWQNPGRPDSGLAAELEKLDQAMQAGLKAANARLLELAPLVVEAENRVNRAQNDLNRLPPSYKVNLVLAKLRPGSDFSYTFMLAGCGWYPSYTLNALPEEEKVEFGFSARLYQQSGFDWKNVKISLATNAPSWNIVPPALDNWRVGPIRHQPAPAPKASAAAQVEMMESYDAAPNAEYQYYGAQPAPPEQAVFSTYAIWDMGQRTILHNQPALIAVKDETLQADFFYTVRPKLSNQAFLTALVKAPAEGEENGGSNYPQANAVFMVEGNTVGLGYYPPEYKDDLFFGSNPALKVASIELTNRSDEKGFFGKTRMRDWHWRFEVENLGAKTVELRVEDSLPMLADARMELKQSSAPEAEIDPLKQMYFWKTTLEPGIRFEIEHKVTVSAPEDVELDSNR